MKKIIIFGNSGSGKTTLAKELVEKYSLPHLDLDSIAWENTDPPTRKALGDSASVINTFITSNKYWVIEGGYSDLLSLVIDTASKVIFLNLDIQMCVENCKERPWEPHKYETFEKQNDNLDMLLGWVKEYSLRQGCFSLLAHRKLFDNFEGDKVEYNSNIHSLK